MIVKLQTRRIVCSSSCDVGKGRGRRGDSTGSVQSQLTFIRQDAALSRPGHIHNNIGTTAAAFIQYELGRFGISIYSL